MEPPTSPRSNALTCTICYEKYTDETGARAPLVLPCGHTYCHECILHFPSRTCPTCRKSIPSDTGDIPRNHALLDLMSAFPPPPPSGKEALKAEGDRHMRSHNYPAAIASYSAAIALDPQSASTALLYSNRSAARALTSDWSAAAEDAQSAIDRDAGFVKAYHRLAQARQQLGQLDEARAAVVEGLRRDPHNAHLAKIRDDIFEDCSVLGIDVSSEHCIVSRLSAAAAAAGGRDKSIFEAVVSLTQAKLAEQHYSLFDEGLYRFIRSAAGEGAGVSGVVISYPPHLSSEEVQTLRRRAGDAGLIVLRTVASLSMLVLYLAVEALPGLSNEDVVVLSVEGGHCSLAVACMETLEVPLAEMKTLSSAPLALAPGEGRDVASAVGEGIASALLSAPPCAARFYLLGEAKNAAVEAAILARNPHAYIGRCRDEHPSRGAALLAAKLSAFESERLRDTLLLDVSVHAVSLQLLDDSIVKMTPACFTTPSRRTRTFALAALSPDYPGRGYLRTYEGGRHTATLCIDGLDPAVPRADIVVEIDVDSSVSWRCSQIAWATGRPTDCAVTAWPGMCDGRGPQSTFAGLPRGEAEGGN